MKRENIRIPKVLSRVGVGRESGDATGYEGKEGQVAGADGRVCAVSGRRQGRGSGGGGGGGGGNNMVMLSWKGKEGVHGGPGEDAIRRACGMYGKVISVRVAEGRRR
jgi:hypothetical protein